MIVFDFGIWERYISAKLLAHPGWSREGISALGQDLRRFMFTCIIILASSWTSGCSFINYHIGGEIDGGEAFQTDSSYLGKCLEATEASQCSGDSLQGDQLDMLLQQASPNKKTAVSVLASGGRFCGWALTADTVLALGRGSGTGGKPRLLPGEAVTLKMSDRDERELNGRIVRLTERNMVLRVGELGRGFPFTGVREISLSDGRLVSGSDLASGLSSQLLAQVPCLVLHVGPRPDQLFFPYDEVQQIRIAPRSTRWGVARTVGVIVGVPLDIGLLWMAWEPTVQGKSGI